VAESGRHREHPDCPASECLWTEFLVFGRFVDLARAEVPSGLRAVRNLKRFALDQPSANQDSDDRDHHPGFCIRFTFIVLSSACRRASRMPNLGPRSTVADFAPTTDCYYSSCQSNTQSREGGHYADPFALHGAIWRTEAARTLEQGGSSVSMPQLLS
jgi:hypothetical protein